MSTACAPACDDGGVRAACCDRELDVGRHELRRGGEGMPPEPPALDLLADLSGDLGEATATSGSWNAGGRDARGR